MKSRPGTTPPVPRSSRLLLLIVAAFLTAADGALVAQDAPSPASGDAAQDADLPRFRTEANFVRVDAYVTKDGVAIGDLAAEDFEILEDGRPQRIETFEHVTVRTRVQQETRREPQSVGESRAMAEDPRARVFVLFLDTHHTGVTGSYRIQRPIVKLLDGMIGEDDVFAVMTPEMSVRDLTFARRTISIEGMLRRHWAWGQEDQLAKPDPVEQAYQTCHIKKEEEWIGLEMIARRRERRTLTALNDLAIALRDLREERKAVIAVTSGWRLFRPNPRLADAGDDQGKPPPLPRPGIGPGGRLEADPNRTGFGSRLDCEADRIHLAHLDNHDYFLDILHRANRGNVSFYPVDAEGLRSWNTDLASMPVGAHADYGRAELNARINTLRLLSEGTDGFAIVNTNDFDRGMRRIVDDLSSYYLLGYYSTNDRLDGKFRSIKVRVNRPGVQVRARRGYQAPTRDEVETARRASTLLHGQALPRGAQLALGALAAAGRDAPVATVVSWALPEPGGAGATMWLGAEIGGAAARSAEWANGGTAEVMVIEADGDEMVGTARTRIEPGSQAVVMELRDLALEPGDYVGRLRLRPSTGVPLAETVAFTVPAGEQAAFGPPLLRRGGPGTAASFVPTARPVFHRGERLRIEVPVAVAVDTARLELLDRNGRTMPTAIDARVEGRDEVQWVVGELVLTPFAPGDYIVRASIESGGRRHESLTAFRVEAR